MHRHIHMHINACLLVKFELFGESFHRLKYVYFSFIWPLAVPFLTPQFRFPPPTTSSHCQFYYACVMYTYISVSVFVLTEGFYYLRLATKSIVCMRISCFLYFFFFCIKISSIKHSLFFISLLSRPKAAAYAFRNRLTPIRISVCMEICMCICIVFVCAWSPRDI